MKIADFSIKHPKIIIMLLLVMVVFGVIASQMLRRSLIADISMPEVVVATTWPGVGAEDIEEQVTRPLEDALGTLEGLNNMTSVSRDSVSIITLELGFDEDAEARIPDIRENINGAMGKLPEELENPPALFAYSSASLPIMTILVEGEGDRSELTTICRDEIIPALSRISGVAQINLNGESSDAVEILADLGRLEALGLSILDIAQIVPRVNMSLPGGDGVYHGYSLNLRTEGRFTSLREIEDQVLAHKDGQYIRLKDAATVQVAEDRRTNYVISRGEDALLLSVVKQKNGDSLRISRGVREALAKVEASYGGGVSFRYIQDDSVNIDMSMGSVITSAVLGVVLAVLILFVFLHNRSATLMIGFSIPLSIMFALIGLWVKGSSLDLITLGGLTGAIGMVVDASIVVLEMIQRHFDGGKDAKEAASLGTEEVGASVVASTATTLAAFFPIIFLTGFAGLILHDVAWTIIFALFSSMLVAIIVVPFLCSMFLKHNPARGLSSRISETMDGAMDRFSRFYKRLLEGAIANRKSFIAGTLILLVISVLSIRLLGFEFLAQSDMAEIAVSVETPGGYTLEMTRDKIMQLEDKVWELIPDEIDDSMFIAGQSGMFATGQKENNRGYGTIRLKRVKDRKRHVTEIINDLQDQIPRLIPDLRAEFSNGGVSQLLSLATGGEGLVVNIYGNAIDTVVQAAEQVRRYMETDPNIVSTDVNIRFNRQEMSARIIHQYLGLLGLSSYEAALTNRVVFNGISLGTYYGTGENIPIELKTNLAGGSIPQDILYRLKLTTPRGEKVSFANFAEFSTEETLSQINHRNKSRSLTVTGSLRDPNVRESMARLTELLDKNGLIPGADWEIGGTTAEMVSSFKSLMLVLAIAVFLVYAVMVIQFERFTQPLLVMSSIPFCLIGVTAGLLVFGSSLSIVSLMGIVALAGIVVNNAIVLIDYTNLLRDKYNMPLEQAVLEGAASRLKPILMTTLTTLLGIIPLAIGTGEGSEIYSPLGQSIFGGLFSSTFITLFFIPVVYMMVEGRRERRKNTGNRE